MSTQTTTAIPESLTEPRRSRRAAHRRPVETPQASIRPALPRPRFRFAPRTVRARIVSLLALPVVSLTALWGIAAVNTISAAYNQSQLKTIDSAYPLFGTVEIVQVAELVDDVLALGIGQQLGQRGREQDAEQQGGKHAARHRAEESSHALGSTVTWPAST